MDDDWESMGRNWIVHGNARKVWRVQGSVRMMHAEKCVQREKLVQRSVWEGVDSTVKCVGKGVDDEFRVCGKGVDNAGKCAVTAC